MASLLLTAWCSAAKEQRRIVTPLFFKQAHGFARSQCMVSILILPILFWNVLVCAKRCTTEKDESLRQLWRSAFFYVTVRMDVPYAYFIVST